MALFRKPSLKITILFVTVIMLTVVLQKMYTRYYDAVITYKMEQLLQREKLHPDNVTRGFKPRNDTNCIRTIEQFKNSEGHFIIPPDNILEALPINVVDCLYHRITSTIQAFCAKRRRHGTMNDGWNICEDGCYKPNKNTSTWVISTVNDKMNAQSMDLHYNIKVYRHKPSLKSGETETDVIPKDENGLFKHSTKFGVWSDEVKRRSIYHACKEDPVGGLQYIHHNKAMTDHTHVVIPEDKTLRHFSRTELNVLYQRYLTSTQIHCKEVLRIGDITDGGWNVCHDTQYRPSYPCLVYSFGISWDFSFDDSVADTYSWVQTKHYIMNTTDFKRGNIKWFHNLGLSDKSGIYGNNKWKVSTLQDIFKELNHTSKTLDILKIDIESMEWQSLPNMIKTGALTNTKQLLVEFHRGSASLQMLQTLRSVYKEGFRIYWYHRNPAKINIIKGKFIETSACFEVYFLKI